MAGVETVTPNQIIEAIKHAKSLNPNDKFGDSAFRVDYKNIKAGSNNVRYINFEVLKKRANNNWVFVPINLKFVKLHTKSRILPPNHDKRKFPGVQLQFAHDANYTTKTNKKDKEGKDIYITEEYGKAKILIAKAYNRIIMKLIKDKLIFPTNAKICLPAQFTRLVDEKTGQKTPLDNPIIRMDIKFKDDETEDKPVVTDKFSKQNAKQTEKSIDPNAKPRCDIYDATKKIEKGDPRYKEGNFNFEPLKFEKKGITYDLTYENIGEVILPGSVVTGVDSISSISLSNLGTSLASKATLLIVTASKGFKPNPTEVFSMDEIESLDSAVTQNIEDLDLNDSKSEIEAEDEFPDLTESIDPNTFEEENIDELDPLENDFNE